MKTFEIKTTHADHKCIRIVCWSWSRNDTRFDVQIDGESILSKYDPGSIRTYAALQSLSAANWVTKKVNEALAILYPDTPYVLTYEIEAALTNAVNVCEAKYGHNSALEGDAEVVFTLEGETA
jgi:hypothetical protein